MGFGLKLALFVMRAIVDAALLKDDTIRQATSAYIDDVFIDENIVSAAGVRQHLVNFGLVSEELELQGDMQILGLKIWGRGVQAAEMETRE